MFDKITVQLKSLNPRSENNGFHAASIQVASAENCLLGMGSLCLTQKAFGPMTTIT